MGDNVVCSEDRSKEAVCCCFCRFPLPTLCESHKDKHPTNTEHLEHFHLPLYAVQCINSKEIKHQYDFWLLKLHQAHLRLQETEGTISRFEEEVEAARREVVSNIETEVEGAKATLSALRRTFSDMVAAAIAETSGHAIDNWDPPSESLAAKVWRFDSGESFDFFTFQVRKRLSFQVHIGTRLPALSQFDRPLQKEAEEMLQEALARIAKLEARNERMKEEIAELKQSNSRLEKELREISELRKAEGDRAQQRATRIIEDMQIEQATYISAELAAIQSHEQAKTIELTTLKETLGTAINLLYKHGVALKREGKYQESMQLLQEAWNSRKQCVSQGQASGKIALALGEVMGLNLSQWSKAIEVLEIWEQECTTPGSECSEVMVRVSNLRSALYFHCAKWSDCEVSCTKSLSLLATAGLDSELLAVTVFLFALALWEQNKSEQANALFGKWEKNLAQKGSEFSEFLYLCLKARAAKVGKAEGFLLDARRIAETNFPASVYAALNLFYLAHMYSQTNRRDESMSKYAEASEVFARHCPGSIFACFNLTCLANLAQECNFADEALSYRLKAEDLYAKFNHKHISRSHNLLCIAELQRDLGQLEPALASAGSALALYESRNCISEVADTMSLMADLNSDLGRKETALKVRLDLHSKIAATQPVDAALNLYSIGCLYEDWGDLVEAEERLEQARCLLEEHSPQSVDAAMNLYRLALLKEKKKETETAREYAKEAYDIWVENHSEDAETKAKPLMDRLVKSKKWLFF